MNQVRRVANHAWQHRRGQVRFWLGGHAAIGPSLTPGMAERYGSGTTVRTGA